MKLADGQIDMLASCTKNADCSWTAADSEAGPTLPVVGLGACRQDTT